MPELPEVETIRRQLEKLIVGKTISSIEVLNPGSFHADPDDLIGKTITDVGRKGKVLIITGDLAGIAAPACRRGRSSRRNVGSPRNDESDPNSKNLFIHLKMSGQLQFIERVKRSDLACHAGRRAAARSDLKRYKHLRVCLNLNSGGKLLFHDQRKFGWITDDPAVLPPGIDALDPALSPNLPRQRRGKLAEILASSNRPIKMILLDQSKIAGIGNIYASEILWQAGISPWAKFRAKGQGPRAKGRNDGKFAKLHAAIRKVLTEAIESGGSTMDDQLYRHVSGQTGNYWSRRRVYDRAGEPCPRPACRLPAGRQSKKNAVIQKTIIAHRSTYFCPNCQR